MKIAQVCPYNLFRSGGVQSHIEYLSKELRKRGHTVKILAPRVDNLENDRDDVYLFGKSVEFPIADTRIELSVSLGKDDKKLRKVLKNEKFDIIHYHEPWIPSLSMQILKESDSVNIGTFHAASRKNLLSQSFTTILMPVARSVANSLDSIIAVSEVPAEYIRELSDHEIHIIPNGIDLKTFHNDYKPFKKYLDGKINILFVGRLDKRKGVKYLVKAFKRLNKHLENVRLIIGGKGDEFEKITKYIERNKIKDVEMLGFVEEKDLFRLYKTCDIFCSPALYGESLGIVLLEAMAVGKPVIGGNNPGYKTVLKDRGSLFLIDPKKVKLFADRLELLCKDEELRDFMSEWGLREVKKYSWERITDRVEKLYTDTIKRRRESYENDKYKDDIEKGLSKWLKKLNGKYEGK